MGLRVTQDKLRQFCAQLRSYITEGKTDQESCALFGLSWNDYEELKAKLIEFETIEITERTPEQLYAEYRLSQEANIAALTTMIGKFEESKQHNAMVSAVKARSEITDRIVEMGQELGLIVKAPERTEVVAGITVAQMGNDELKKLITDELAALSALMLGTQGTIIDITPGPLHRPDPVLDTEVALLQEPKPVLAIPETVAVELSKETAAKSKDQGKRHSRNKVHGGRRVVKKKVSA